MQGVGSGKEPSTSMKILSVIRLNMRGLSAHDLLGEIDCLTGY
jgi:hypothetical protein